MSNQKEFRTADINAVDDEEMKIQGFALRFNEESNLLGEFVEVISPEALEDADMSDVRMLIDHNSSYVIGRTTAGTLDLEVTEEGLYFRCTLPPTSYARDIYENIKLGNVSQCSFGMVVGSDGDSFERRDDGIFKRTINKIQTIFDCSVVSFPAYNSSSVEPALRSIEHIKQEETNKIEEQRSLELAKAELELLRLKK
ncbi:HK97 family phage prohead protease [Staphylococcus cohnii]|uniref:HK97 family phage prohead protease n=1 Tax=Staphylococcus cohnii TaxID=29382 RepID=UPI003D7E6CF9